MVRLELIVPDEGAIAFGIQTFAFTIISIVTWPLRFCVTFTDDIYYLF